MQAWADFGPPPKICLCLVGTEGMEQKIESTVKVWGLGFRRNEKMETATEVQIRTSGGINSFIPS